MRRPTWGNASGLFVMHSPWSNFIWKLAIALSVATSLVSIYQNGKQVDRLEKQVCDTVTVQVEALPRLMYYRKNPDELREALANSRATLERFHCSLPPEVK